MEAGEDYDSHTLKNMMHHNPTKEYMLNYEQCPQGTTLSRWNSSKPDSDKG